MFQNIRTYLQPPQFEDNLGIQRARLLFVTLAIIFIVPLLYAGVFFAVVGSLDLVTLASTLVVSFSAFILLFLARQERLINVASFFLCLIFAATVTYVIFNGGGLRNPTFAAYFIVIIMASLLLGGSGAITFTALIIAASLFLYIADIQELIPPFLTYEVDFVQWLSQAILFGISGTLLYYSTSFIQESTLKIRRATNEAQNLSRNQEALVKARTRDLQLAAEVGNRISSIRELDQLLSQAVELIQATFSFYYVQIYLADASGGSLALQAGTGSSGSTLVQQGHRLPISTDSVNGTAAVTRQPVLISNTQEKSSVFRPNALLPETKAEMAIPLISGHNLLGVLDIQSSQTNELSEQLLPAFQILASQLAIAIENANLFTQVTQTQEMLSAQTRRLSRRNWDEYLGNIDNPERLRALYSKESVRHIDTAETMHDAIFTTDIQVAGEKVGLIQIENASNYEWTSEDAELVNTVAQQVGQQVENLRLLYEAERYRSEAENALRRLTRDNWQEYLQNKSTKGYHFTNNQIEAVDTGLLAGSSWKTALQIRGEDIGEVAIKKDEPLNEESVHLVQAVANRLGAHLENIRLTQQAERRVAELAIINDVNDAIQETQDLSKLLEAVGNRIKLAFNASTTYLALYDEEKQQVAFPYYVIDDEKGYRRPELNIIPFGEGITSHIIKTGQPLLINDSHEQMVQLGARALDLDLQPTSFLGVPIISGYQILGVISVQNATYKRAFTDSDLNLLSTIASGIGVAIQNTRLFEQNKQALAQAEKQSQELITINRVVTQTSKTQNIQEGVQYFANEMLKAIDVDQVGVALFLDADGLTVVGIADKDEIRATQGKGVKIPLEGNLLTQKVIETRKTVVVADIQTHPLTKSIRKLMADNGFESLAIIPMTAGEEIIGTVGLASINKNHPLNEEQLRLAETLALQASTSFKNIRLVEQLSEYLENTELQAQRLASLTQMGAELNRVSSMKEVYETAAQKTAEIFEAAHVAFTQVLPTTAVAEVKFVAGLNNNTPPGYMIFLDSDPLGQAILENRLLAFPTADADNPIKTIMVAPISIGDNVIGSLILGKTGEGASFDNTDKNLVLQVTSLLGSVIANNQLLTETQKRAEQEQLINSITQKIQNTVTIETALQTALEELGKAFQVPYSQIELTGHKTNGQSK